MQTGPLARVMRLPTWYDANDRIRDVAARMAESGESCALVRDGRGVGIVTDTVVQDRIDQSWIRRSTAADG